MLEILNITALLAVAYLLGSIPFGLVVTRVLGGSDPRKVGSGNIGATNVLRAGGKKAGIATLALDIVKGVLAVWFAGYMTEGDPGWMANAALAVVAGHIFPVFLEFQGGKGVATFAGAFGYLLPAPFFATMLVFFGILYLTRYVSAASIVSAATFPVAAITLSPPSLTMFLMAAIASGLVIWRHQSNIKRIRMGTEPIFHWGSKPAPSKPPELPDLDYVARHARRLQYLVKPVWEKVYVKIQTLIVWRKSR